MSRRHLSWGEATFEALYARSADPWNFASSAYEQAKYRATLASLSERRFRSAFEAGCSIGVLTRALSQRCDRLVACDLSARAVTAARSHCAGRSGLRIECRRLPRDWPRGRYDLIVLSEMLYFLGGADLRQMARRCRLSLKPGGVVLLVNWTGPTDTPLTGNQAAARLISLLRGHANPVRRLRRPGFRIDRLTSGQPYILA